MTGRSRIPLDPQRLRIVALIAIVAVANFLYAADPALVRIEIGTRIFRALLAADVDLAGKATANQLQVVLLYRSDAARAQDVAKGLTGINVRGMAVVTEVTKDLSLAKYASKAPAAIFIAEPLPREALRSIVKYGIDRRVIVYSPFEGDVENGVLGGLSVEAQVRPFVNAATLDASKINLKSIFLQAAKVVR